MKPEALEIAQHVPVLIVGGGVVGLSAALFLRKHGIEAMLVERHAGTSIHPRARGLNTRAMELYRALDVEGAIRTAGEATPIHLGLLFGETLAQAIDAPIGKLFRRALRWMVGRDLSFGSASPTRGCRITQDLLEPVLANEARARGATLEFSTELVSFQQDDGGVDAVLRDRRTEATRPVRADYLLACDGAKSPVRTALGVGTSGRGSLGHLLNVLFEADLADFVRGREFSLALIHRADVRGLFAAIDNRARWVFHIVYDANRESPRDFPPERCAALIRSALGADVPIRIQSVLPWESAARVADRYRVGRVLLAGDAAHLMPPWGGMGANTGIADACDLAWKLALVLRGEARPALLDTYEAERRPVGIVAAEDAADNTDEAGLMHRATFKKMFGRQASKPPHAGVAPPPGRWFKLFGVGYRYTSTAVSTEPSLQRFALDGRPGTRLPHGWITRASRRASSLDLVATRFTLVGARDAIAWCDAAREVANELGVVIDVLRAGVDFDDPRRRWQRSAGLGPRGALLARPDGFVAWRAADAEANAREVLRGALGRALCA